MSRMNFRPAFTSKAHDMLKTMLIFFGIMVLITAAMCAVVLIENGRGGNVNGSFTVFGFASAVTMFVVGISSIRDELRMNIQFGVGRLTTFAAMLVNCVIFSLGVSIAGELLTTVTALLIGSTNFEVFDIFAQLFFASGTISLGEHIMSVLCAAAILILGYLVGVFISMVFFRLSKGGKILVGVGAPALIWVIFPIIAAVTEVGQKIAGLIVKLFEFMAKSPWNFILVSLICAVIAAVLDWLLIRRAPIKAIKG